MADTRAWLCLMLAAAWLHVRLIWLQEDSMKAKKHTHVAGLFFLPFATYSVGPKPSPLETADGGPEAVLFKRLQGLRRREQVSLKPGRIMVAVYGDN